MNNYSTKNNESLPVGRQAQQGISLFLYTQVVCNAKKPTL